MVLDISLTDASFRSNLPSFDLAFSWKLFKVTVRKMNRKFPKLILYILCQVHATHFITFPWNYCWWWEDLRGVDRLNEWRNPRCIRKCKKIEVFNIGRKTERQNVFRMVRGWMLAFKETWVSLYTNHWNLTTRYSKQVGRQIACRSLFTKGFEYLKTDILTIAWMAVKFCRLSPVKEGWSHRERLKRLGKRSGIQKDKRQSHWTI